MYWFIGGIIALALGVYYKSFEGKFCKKRVVDGEITRIVTESQTVWVKYQYSYEQQPVEAAFTDEEADFSKLEAGTRVLVCIDCLQPEKPVIALYNISGKNRTVRGSERAAFIIAAVCFIMGIISLI